MGLSLLSLKEKIEFDEGYLKRYAEETKALRRNKIMKEFRIVKNWVDYHQGLAYGVFEYPIINIFRPIGAFRKRKDAERFISQVARKKFVK
jgi:hypothetical protein